MNLELNTHSIEAISICLPQGSMSLEQELELCGLNEKKLQTLRENTGISRHFVCDENTFASDLASKALEKLLEQKLVHKDELDMVIFSTFCPDFLAPACTSLLHKNLALNENTLCFDMTSFCPGFIQGIFQAFLALEQSHINTIVLLYASTKSKRISPKDKITFLTNTDSAVALLVRKSNLKEQAFFSQKIFSHLALKETLPTNAFNQSASNLISVDTEVFFSFIMQNFPTFFEDFFKHFGQDKKEIKHFCFQAPNVFVKQKLLDSLNLEKQKEDPTLKNYGDTTINKLAFDIYSLINNGGGDLKRSSLEVLGQGSLSTPCASSST